MRPDKMSRLTVVPGWLKIKVEQIKELPKNSLTTSLSPLKEFPVPPKNEPTWELMEFEGDSEKDVHPYTTYVNHLYVYPRSLSFDTQKTFTRARNLACVVELRASDEEGAHSLCNIYGRPGGPLFVSQCFCTVLHHSTVPTWYEEVKMKLPIHIHTKHHLLFTFYHISCEPSKKRESGIESCVGYSWLPLLHKGRLNVEEQALPVASNLPSGYLTVQPLGLGKGYAGPEVSWIDGQRPIFSVGFQLVSTVVTRDQHLHNMFSHTDRLLDPKSTSLPSESETCKILKAAHAIQLPYCITFLPTLLNHLFSLLVVTTSEEVGLNIIRVLIHMIHMIHEAGRKEVLQAYIKFVFVPPSVKSLTTVHEEMSRHLPILLRPANTDFLVVNKFMHHSNFFFEIIIKSMAQHLLATGRIKMHRNERFSADFLFRIQNLLQVLCPYLIQKHKEMPEETQELNRSLAQFLKKCLTFMDRGYVFKLINSYLDKFNPGDPKILYDYKFTFLQIICSHEHYVAFNLPFIHTRIGTKTRSEYMSEFCLSEEFCKQHFLVGLLLQEVRTSLNEVFQVRKTAVATLRDLLAKHELDDRYQNKGQLSRILALYVPWLGIVLENLNRLNAIQEESTKQSLDILTAHGSNSHMSSSSSFLTYKDTNSSSSVGTPRSVNRLTLHLDQGQTASFRDSAYFSAIAGQNLINGNSSVSLDSDTSTVSGDAQSTISQETAIIREPDNEATKDAATKTHLRSHSVTHSSQLIRYDKLHTTEVKDLLLCFMMVVKYLDNQYLIAWWQQCTETELLSFFRCIEICLHQFKYLGKRQIATKLGSTKPGAIKAMTLPARMQPPDFSGDVPSALTIHTGSNSIGRDNIQQIVGDTESSKLYQALLEANMATEVGLIALDALGLYCIHFKDNLLSLQGENAIMRKVFDIYLSFLQVGQSETLFRHVFAALRAYINNFSVALFQGNAQFCGRLCYELLRCCNSRLSTIRQESCALLYLLMRSNFEFSSRKGLTRVHLQVIISVSQMLGNVIGLNNARFQESLSLINSYASSDKVMKGTGFPGEVKDLTKRIRTVLMATAQMREHHHDPEMLVDLQHSLANSYASTPELRHTWLETMSRNHVRDGNFSEAAMCQLHVAALMAEYLKLKKVHPWGAEAFNKISSNIAHDERSLKLDAVPPSISASSSTQSSLTDASAFAEFGALSLGNQSPSSLSEVSSLLSSSSLSIKEQKYRPFCFPFMFNIPGRPRNEKFTVQLRTFYTCFTTSKFFFVLLISSLSSKLPHTQYKDTIPLQLINTVTVDLTELRKDIQYTEFILLEQLEQCADYMEKAERYELLGELNRLIIPIYEHKRNYEALAHRYKTLAQSYSKIVEVTRSGRRLLGRYYRVAFFGQAYFEEDSGVEYIYKEPKVTSLSEISERLYRLYCDKFGQEVIKIIMDSVPVDPSVLDPKYAYIQVTSVASYFEKGDLEDRQTEFEQSHDINCFMYETPFTKEGKAQGNPEDQWKRRTILTTLYTFPYVKKRIAVVKRRVLELNPIEVALDEMQLRVSELEEVVFSKPTDTKKLQLRLQATQELFFQGSVCVQVNAGPFTYASIFLDPSHASQYPDDKLDDLKDIYRRWKRAFATICAKHKLRHEKCRFPPALLPALCFVSCVLDINKEFVKICYTALQINGKLISSDQIEYQEVLRQNYQKLCQELSTLFGESLWPDEEIGCFKRNSQALFSVISGASGNSTLKLKIQVLQCSSCYNFADQGTKAREDKTLELLLLLGFWVINPAFITIDYLGKEVSVVPDLFLAVSAHRRGSLSAGLAASLGVSRETHVEHMTEGCSLIGSAPKPAGNRSMGAPASCFSLLSVQALAMVLFISSSPVSYICFIMSMRPPDGSSPAPSILGNLESRAFFSEHVMLRALAAKAMASREFQGVFCGHIPQFLEARKILNDKQFETLSGVGMGLQSFPLGLKRLLDIGVPLNDSFCPGFICDDGSSLASDTPTTSGIPRPQSGHYDEFLSQCRPGLYGLVVTCFIQELKHISLKVADLKHGLLSLTVMRGTPNNSHTRLRRSFAVVAAFMVQRAVPSSDTRFHEADVTTRRNEWENMRTVSPLLIHNTGHFIKNLPDKGSKMCIFREKLSTELKRREEVEEACGLFSELNISSQVNKQLEQIEWTGTLSDRKSPDSNAESEDETNPIKILATHAGVGAYSKKHRYRVEKTMKSLIKPEDLGDQETVLNEVVSKSGYIDTLCEKIDKPRENKRGSFKPYKTLTNSDDRLKENVPKRAPHSWWEVTAATPPLPIHSNTKLVSLHQSLQLQQEQAVQLKAIQVKQAASRLSSRSNVHMSSTLPHDVLRGEHHSDFETEPDHGQYQHHSDSDIEEAHSQAEEDTVVMFSLDYD
uniref:Dedicator of cytokinesis protein 9 n=1 Tax=Timema douglasi TaxID=61478 RepID=A0A7R8VAR5_TIMDO|nr:unnamed protein product [Timema douglasi]